MCVGCLVHVDCLHGGRQRNRLTGIVSIKSELTGSCCHANISTKGFQLNSARLSRRDSGAPMATSLAAAAVGIAGTANAQEPSKKPETEEGERNLFVDNFNALEVEAANTHRPSKTRNPLMNRYLIHGSYAPVHSMKLEQILSTCFDRREGQPLNGTPSVHTRHIIIMFGVSAQRKMKGGLTLDIWNAKEFEMTFLADRRRGQYSLEIRPVYVTYLPVQVGRYSPNLKGHYFHWDATKSRCLLNIVSWEGWMAVVRGARAFIQVNTQGADIFSNRMLADKLFPGDLPTWVGGKMTGDCEFNIKDLWDQGGWIKAVCYIRAGLHVQSLEASFKLIKL